MGRNADEGVIDDRHEVFGYPGLYVIDGRRRLPPNPGVNPFADNLRSLAERAMSFIPVKTDPPSAG